VRDGQTSPHRPRLGHRGLKCCPKPQISRLAVKGTRGLHPIFSVSLAGKEEGTKHGMHVGSAPAEERVCGDCSFAFNDTQGAVSGRSGEPSHSHTPAHAQNRATDAADVTRRLRRDWAATPGPGPGARAPTRPPTPTLAAAAAPGPSASSVSVSRGSCPGGATLSARGWRRWLRRWHTHTHTHTHTERERERERERETVARETL